MASSGVTAPSVVQRVAVAEANIHELATFRKSSQKRFQNETVNAVTLSNGALIKVAC